MTPERLNILAIDDDPGDVEILRRQLEQIDAFAVSISSACNWEQAEAVLAERAIELIFLDYLLGDKTGLDLLREMRQGGELRPVIILTGQGDENAAAALTRAGADDYLVKGDVNPQILRRGIEHANSRYHRRRLECMNAKLVQELKEMNDTLKIKNRRLSELYETAHEFVDNVSHEFRTPLTVIKEFTSILVDGLAGSLTDEQVEFVTIIGARADDLTLMVNDMLDISKLEAGVLGLSRRCCDLESIVGHVRSILERKAIVSKVTLEIDIDGDLPKVHCDPEKIGRVIINLVVNAIKFSRENGHVRLIATFNEIASEVAVKVCDSGPGIDQEHLSEIFERFKQVGGEARSSTKGFGLGLSIARELVHLNFGDIGVESELGKGSTFTFTIPTADSTSFIERYLDRIEAYQNGSPFASLIRVDTLEDHDARSLDDLELLIQHGIRRSDLVFPIHAGAWLLVLASNHAELQELMRRLDGARRDANRNRPAGPLPAFRCTTEGTWRVSDGRKEFTKRFCSIVKNR